MCIIRPFARRTSAHCPPSEGELLREERGLPEDDRVDGLAVIKDEEFNNNGRGTDFVPGGFDDRDKDAKEA